MRSSFDTNIAVYALLDLGSPRKTAIAQRLLRGLSDSGECVISTQVLNEFVNVATRKLQPPMPEQELADNLEDLTAFDVIQVSELIIASAIRRHYASRTSYYDALIVEACIAGGAEVLYTEDLQHGAHFGALLIVNPFLGGYRE
jgi:predicted nucleic acid-binding protein